MKSRKVQTNKRNFWPELIQFLIFAIFFSSSAAASEQTHPDNTCELPSISGIRYIKLDKSGQALANQNQPNTVMAWSCIYDQHTQLVWEIKSDRPGLHFNGNRLTWHNVDNSNNGGFAGYQKQGFCTGSDCDTSSFIKAINIKKFCGSTQWRLPTREELRSLVDYGIPAPGPTIDKFFFPHTLAQYYWSATPDSDDKDSVWGIGFSFGFDYAYFKSHAGYVRAVYSAPR